MNFPDLETCEAIGEDFHESEFIVVPYKITKHVEIETYGHFHDPEQQHEWIIRRKDLWSHAFTLIDGDPLAAPTCDELGEWVDNWLSNIGYVNLSRHQKKLLDKFEGSWSKALRDADTETQARAEVVKLILESA